METVLATGPARAGGSRRGISPTERRGTARRGHYPAARPVPRKRRGRSCHHRRPELAFVARRPRARGQESADRHQGRGRTDGRDVSRRRSRAAVLQRDSRRRQPDCVARRAGADGQRAATPVAGAGQHPHGAASGDADGGAFPQPPEGVTVLQDFDPSLPDVVGDTGALERTFLNLIKNAVGSDRRVGHHSPAYKNRARIPDDRGRPSSPIPASRDQRQQRRHPGDQLSQLFTPFFTTKPAGTGLGLVLCQRIIALHGGRLWAARGGVDRVKGAASKRNDLQGHAPDDAARQTPDIVVRAAVPAIPDHECALQRQECCVRSLQAGRIDAEKPGLVPSQVNGAIVALTADGGDRQRLYQSTVAVRSKLISLLAKGHHRRLKTRGSSVEERSSYSIVRAVRSQRRSSRLCANRQSPAASAPGEPPELRVAAIIRSAERHGTERHLTGFSIDLWNAIAARLKVKTSYQIVPDVSHWKKRCDPKRPTSPSASL